MLLRHSTGDMELALVSVSLELRKSAADSTYNVTGP